jgi:AcrR family transcriptional regulator
MKDVAGRAKVSPATVFNLLGSKDGLFYALLSRLLDDLFIGVRRYTSPDPLEHAIEATDFVVDAFLADPVVFRELFLVFLGTRDEMHRPWFLHRSLSFWRHSVEVAAADNAVPLEDVESDELPRTLMLGFIGAFYLWVHGDIDDEGFRAQALYGTALTIVGASKKLGAGRLGNRLKEIKRQLPKHHTFLRHLIPGSQKGSRSDRAAVRLGPVDVDARPGARAPAPSKSAGVRRSGTGRSPRK